ncbi:MAG: hypothetical protein U1B78_06950 [Dehalococcoidia bacterium]|nr:hypothetical protein [Dehalococcoidia bacterium]
MGSAIDEASDRFFSFDPGDLSGLALLRSSFLSADTTATGVPTSYTLAFISAIVAISLITTVLARDGDHLALFALWMSSYFLVYGSWEHHYNMLLPVLVLLVALRPPLRPIALAAFVLVALPTPYWLLNNVWNTSPVPENEPLFNPQDVWPMWGVIVHHASKAIPVAVLWAYLAASLLRRGVEVPRILSAKKPEPAL